jgi:hypothetical protein
MTRLTTNCSLMPDFAIKDSGIGERLPEHTPPLSTR